ncbi:MAG: chorismate lyase [Pseudohongiellaceae bacterium]|nr:chorismate lyase [Pseudohongiellaceae bacterium]
MTEYSDFDLISNGSMRWRNAKAVVPRLSPFWSSWLLDEGSLTQRLKVLGRGDFAVELLDERWLHSTRAIQLVGLRAAEARQRLWSRKVVLKCAGEPCVAAHTLIPYSSMSGSLRQLRHLDDKPLGEFLFKKPELKRVSMHVCSVGDSKGRYSVFRLQGFPVLVAEFFLPNLQNLVVQQQKTME